MARPFLVASLVAEGSILVMMMAKLVGFATLRSDFVWIRFRLAVRRLRGLCWTCIVCGTLSFSQPTDISTFDNPGAEIRWG